MKAPAQEPLRPGQPLTVKLSAIIATLVVVGLSLAGATITVALRIKLTDEIDQRLVATLASLGRPEQLGAAMSGPSDYVLLFFDQTGELTETVTGRSGVSRALPALDQLTAEQAAGRKGEPFTVRAASGNGKWRAIAAEVVGPKIGALVLALPYDSVVATTRAMTLMVVWTALAAAVLATVFGYLMVLRSLRSLKNVEQAAAQIAAGDLSTRIPSARPGTEVGRLTDSLNAMLSQIEAAFAAQAASEGRMRSFVSDASHELRTPLAAIRGYAELYRMGALEDDPALRGAMRRIEDEATRMGLLVSDLLTLARLDEARPQARQPVDLPVLVGDVLADAKALDPSRPLTFLMDGAAGPTTVIGDESALRRVVTNLVANAIQHTPPGSPVELAVSLRGDGWTVLEVQDHGPGIPLAKRSQVFDRFFRVDGSRSRDSGGSGLGLAIVAGLVAAHGGTVEVDDTPGGGATFRVALPPPGGFPSDQAGANMAQGHKPGLP
ncbi:MAG: HAMP domain-containing histidine kinase [Bifidobacteriaceae bacterium]|nr:HAMP domain-containing histidine kinase [Bifidobacteriaceae bacterium]